MVLFILLAIIVIANLVVGVLAAGQMGIGPGLNEILKWQPDIRFGRGIFERRPDKPTKVKAPVHFELLRFNQKQLERFSEFECRYVPAVTSILDQLNAAVGKLPWVASELEYFCRIVDGRYQSKSVEQSRINTGVKYANDLISRFGELFEKVLNLKDCPRALIWIWECNEQFVQKFSDSVKEFVENNQDQNQWIVKLGEATNAICELSDSLQLHWRSAVVKCFENKPLWTKLASRSVS